MGGLLFTAAAADRGISSQGAKGTRKEKALLKQKVRGSLHAFHLISMRTATDADAAALASERQMRMTMTRKPHLIIIYSYQGPSAYNFFRWGIS